MYECLYVFQWFTNMYVNCQAICGHDYLFLCLAVNFVAQFRMLQAVIREVGTEIEEEINGKLKKINPNYNGDLLTNCIQHHNMLLE